uniref:Uncharacterized protein n=1 Tax=Rhizophora mucronata TaxID=61149 RepID=A0A2P2QDQ1_RHIMU
MLYYSGVILLLLF